MKKTYLTILCSAILLLGGLAGIPASEEEPLLAWESEGSTLAVSLTNAGDGKSLVKTDADMVKDLLENDPDCTGIQEREVCGTKEWAHQFTYQYRGQDSNALCLTRQMPDGRFLSLTASFVGYPDGEDTKEACDILCKAYGLERTDAYEV